MRITRSTARDRQASPAEDRAVYPYDAGGHQVTADNPFAEVHRSYLPNGAVLTDTLVVRPWDNFNGGGDAFVLTHTYDLDGRRRATHGAGGDTLALDPAGRVSGIGDPAGHWFLYRYDRLGRPDTITYANGGRLIRTYDADNEVTRRIELDPASATLHNDTLMYDARGKVVHAIGTIEEDVEGYSALGTLWSSLRQNTQSGPAFENNELFTADAMGNVVQHVVVRNSGSLPSRDSTVSVYVPRTGRLLATHSLTTNDTITYTAAGERQVTDGYPSPQGTTPNIEGDHYYYRADGLLIAVDHRTCLPLNKQNCTGTLVAGDKLQGAFDEYHYDALGRRVMIRTLTDSVCAVFPCVNAITDVVFDGAAITAEIRSPARATDSVAAGDNLGIQPPAPPPNGATAAFYGTVDYLNGPELDKPLEMQNIVPYRTWREVVDSGQCLSVCGVGNVTYPGHSYEAYLSLIPSTQSAPTGWHGSLFDEGMGDGGLMYRRNRYYDPATGQFTQEDPLGLAGGMSAYGFAEGDPISFSDPFGLTCWERGNCTQSETYTPPPDGIERSEGGTDLAAAAATLLVMSGIRGAISVGRALFSSSDGNASATATKGTSRVDVGTRVYRVYGGKAGKFGRSWTTVDPNATPNYASQAGLPAENSRTSVVSGVISDMNGVSLTTAAPGASGPGGIPEVVIPDAARQVKVTGDVTFHP